MGWLAQQLAAAGGQRLARRVQAVEELAGHDVVVNCTGGSASGNGKGGRAASGSAVPIKTAPVSPWAADTVAYATPPTTCSAMPPRRAGRQGAVWRRQLLPRAGPCAACAGALGEVQGVGLAGDGARVS